MPAAASMETTNSAIREEMAIPHTVPEQDPAVAPELRCELVTSEESIRALGQDYAHLYGAAGNTLPFALQEWHLCWCAHFLNHNEQISDQPVFCVVREPAGACVAIVPLILTRRRIGPLKVVWLDLLGADPGLTEIAAPLIVPGYERLVVRAVHRALVTVPDWDWINWRGISAPFAAALAVEARPRWYGDLEDYLLDLPPSWEQLRSGLPRNVRESLRHCYNSLKRDGHAFELVVARTATEVERALGTFLQLHAMRADLASTPIATHLNRFAGRSVQRFLYDVCRTLAARDAVRIFQLRIGSDIVAARIGFVVGDSVYLYYSGFNPAWARYGVMTTTVAEAFKYAMASGLKRVNLSLTREQSKMRWRPRLVQYYSAVAHRKALRSLITCRAYCLTQLKPSGPVRLLTGFIPAQRSWS